jgi:hypothetical protein
MTRSWIPRRSPVELRRRIVWLLCAFSVAPGCFYHSGEWGQRNIRNEDRYTSEREVQVGLSVSLTARPVGDAVVAQMLAQDWCWNARIGTRKQSWDRCREKTCLAWYALMPIGIGIPPALVCTFMPKWRCRTESRDFTIGDWVRREPRRCAEPRPLAGRQLRFSAISRGVNEGLEARTDQTSGQATFDVRALRQLAAYCGPQTWTVSPPWQNNDLHELFRRRHEGQQRYGLDMPSDNPRGAAEVALKSTPAEAPSLESLDPKHREIALKCIARRRSPCLQSFPRSQATLSCEESCGQRVNVLRCVFGERNCVAKGLGSQQECQNKYRECLVAEGVAVDVFHTCVHTCVAEKEKATCP